MSGLLRRYLQFALLPIALLMAAPTVAEARWRCFFFCHAHAHTHTHHARAYAESRFCRGVKNAYGASKVNSDSFATGFPADKQDQVRACLEGVR